MPLRYRSALLLLALCATLASTTSCADVSRAKQQNLSRSNIRVISLGLVTYERTVKRFPLAAVRSKEDGKPLLSWRVAMLPLLEEQALYKEFKLDEPWDSEHNKPLIEKMPAIYAHPSGIVKEKGRTVYLAPICKGSVFSFEKGAKVDDIVDGTSKTILVVEANPEKAVIWTKPDDLEVDLADPLAGLGGVWKEGILVGFADVHTSLLKPSVKPEVLRRLFQANDGEQLKSDEYELSSDAEQLENDEFE